MLVSAIERLDELCYSVGINNFLTELRDWITESNSVNNINDWKSNRWRQQQKETAQLVYSIEVKFIYFSFPRCYAVLFCIAEKYSLISQSKNTCILACLGAKWRKFTSEIQYSYRIPVGYITWNQHCFHKTLGFLENSGNNLWINLQCSNCLW